MAHITINKKPGTRMIELGGGENPNPSSDVNVDVRPGAKVHFQVDFEQYPWAINSNEWDVVYSAFCLEHITYTKTVEFLKECRRILKPGGQLILVLPNTEAQIKWLQANPDGWDGKPAFVAMSELLFGSQDYSANAHKAFFNPTIAMQLLNDAGFEKVTTQPYGDRDTDMGAVAFRPATDTTTLPPNTLCCPRCLAAVANLPNADNLLACVKCDLVWNPANPTQPLPAAVPAEVKPPVPALPAEEMYDKHYFNGGQKVGGYANEGYRDFPVHEVTFRQILARKPESVLEIGCARGYLVKRLQDAGIYATGLEISKHCYLTRAANNIFHHNMCAPGPWPLSSPHDLAFSIAVLEHIPEAALPHVFGELKKLTKRGLHGIDFGHKDDGFDKTHTTLKPKEWWVERFAAAGLHGHEIVDKEELERGQFPQELLTDPHGKLKLNLGSHMVMAHRGWINIDALDLAPFAAANGFQFKQLDITAGLPFPTSGVDLIAMSHVLEHMPYAVGLSLLKECRRLLKPGGALRIAVPDAQKLMSEYMADMSGTHLLSEYDEINDQCGGAISSAGKLWALLHEGHHACYDLETLGAMLEAANLVPYASKFREYPQQVPAAQQILQETIDMFACLSCYMVGTPKV